MKCPKDFGRWKLILQGYASRSFPPALPDRALALYPAPDRRPHEASLKFSLTRRYPGDCPFPTFASSLLQIPKLQSTLGKARHGAGTQIAFAPLESSLKLPFPLFLRSAISSLRAWLLSTSSRVFS